ncbi:MAG TPA: hypothetical protein VGZ26_01020, partial [Pirellulales bacterium]|nr:hypothetical protein [Pirellulales bacterium]
MPDIQTPHRTVATSTENGVVHRQTTANKRVSAADGTRRPEPITRFIDALRRLAGRRLPRGAGDVAPARRRRDAFETREWKSTAAQPEFLLQCQIPAGWVQVRFDIETTSIHPIEIYLDTGGDFNSADVLRIRTDHRSFTSDRSWFVPKPIRAIRLAPTDSAEPFRIRNFSIQSISKLTFYSRAVRHLLGQAATQKRLLSVLKKGLKALAT